MSSFLMAAYKNICYSKLLQIELVRIHPILELNLLQLDPVGGKC